MKIAFISMIRDSWGGSEELWYSAANEAIREGHTVLHSSYKCGEIHPKISDLKSKGGHIFFRRGYIRPSTPSKSRFLIQGLNFLKNTINNPFNNLFRYDPDIVVYTGTAYSIGKEKYLRKFLYKKKTRFYIIVQLNEENLQSESEYVSNYIREAYGLSSGVFFVSNKNLKVAEHQLASKIKNAVVLRNPVNLNNIDSVPYPAGNRAELAMVGNLVVIHKGQDVAIAALASPEFREKDFRLNIYGTGKDEAYLKNLVKYYQLEDKIVFHGKATDIRRVWSENQILLMPSHMEGMPLVVVEAMLCGRTCVAADAGGITEWIEEGKSGFVAETATISCFQKALCRAWEQKDRWKEYGDLARGRALQLYDPQPGKTLLKELLK
jgi:L-malate glycosyltransferase